MDVLKIFKLASDGQGTKRHPGPNWCNRNLRSLLCSYVYVVYNVRAPFLLFFYLSLFSSHFQLIILLIAFIFTI